MTENHYISQTTFTAKQKMFSLNNYKYIMPQFISPKATDD